MPRFCPISCDLGSKTLSQRRRDGGSKAWTRAFYRDEWKKSNNEQKSRWGQRVSLHTPHHKLKRHTVTFPCSFLRWQNETSFLPAHILFTNLSDFWLTLVSAVSVREKGQFPLLYFIQTNTLAVEGWDKQNFTIRGWVTGGPYNTTATLYALIYVHNP